MHALLVVDMQKGCMAGSPPRHEVPAVVERINRLAEATRKKGLVVFVQHTDAREGLPRGSQAWEILDELVRREGDLCVEKEGCDSFLETNLRELLDARGVRELTIVGCASDFCVDTTVRSAGGLGYRVTVASDAHTTRDRPHVDAVSLIRHLNYVWADFLLPRGAKIRVVDTATIVSELS